MKTRVNKQMWGNYPFRTSILFVPSLSELRPRSYRRSGYGTAQYAINQHECIKITLINQRSLDLLNVTLLVNDQGHWLVPLVPVTCCMTRCTAVYCSRDPSAQTLSVLLDASQHLFKVCSSAAQVTFKSSYRVITFSHRTPVKQTTFLVWQKLRSLSYGNNQNEPDNKNERKKMYYCKLYRVEVVCPHGSG